MQTKEILYESKAEEWYSPIFDEETQKAVRKLAAEDPDAFLDCFWKDLEFGTGGMRGIMGVGTNRINKYTLGKSTQGICNYLKETVSKTTYKVAIAYDCRNQSAALAQVVAEVFSANGIQVFIFSNLRPTPLLSYAVKNLSCDCGIMLTASHNPPEYNGYKVYWHDGGQLVPPQDGEIIEAIQAIGFEDINFEKNPALIQYIDNDLEEKFCKESVQHASFIASKEAKSDIKIVFTSLHGTAITLVPRVLKMAGFTDVYFVEDQSDPDGNFPTVQSPNPEEPEALSMALELADTVNADLVIGTDPDGDRLGIAIRDNFKNLRLLNGNQIMMVLVNFLLEYYRDTKQLTGNEFIATTIVSTPVIQKLAKDFGVVYQEVLTGFKWIAKLIKDQPQKRFIGGGEESFGFMVGDFVRDKDAITATILACEMAAYYKSKGTSIYDSLCSIYKKHHIHQERLVSIVKKGKSGAAEIDAIIKNLRENPPSHFAEEAVVRIEDYKTSVAHDLAKNTQYDLQLPAANVLIFYTEKGSKIAVRPSGTEPKIKFYVSLNKYEDHLYSYENVSKYLDGKIDEIIEELPIHS